MKISKTIGTFSRIFFPKKKKYNISYSNTNMKLVENFVFRELLNQTFSPFLESLYCRLTPTGAFLY